MLLSHLYIVKSKHGLTKIGRSACPKRRITEIAKATGTPVVKRFISPLCLNAQEIERQLHEHFAEYRQEGEWFAVDFQTVVDEAKKQEFQTDEPNKLMPFEFDSSKLRIVLDENGEPWFVAKDVCDALEHSNHKVALQGLDGDEVRKVYLTDSVGRKQKTNVVDESGFYTLYFAPP
jgi:hypothetical protein